MDEGKSSFIDDKARAHHPASSVNSTGTTSQLIDGGSVGKCCILRKCNLLNFDLAVCREKEWIRVQGESGEPRHQMGTNQAGFGFSEDLGEVSR